MTETFIVFICMCRCKGKKCVRCYAMRICKDKSEYLGICRMLANLTSSIMISKN